LLHDPQSKTSLAFDNTMRDYLSDALQSTLEYVKLLQNLLWPGLTPKSQPTGPVVDLANHTNPSSILALHLWVTRHTPGDVNQGGARVQGRVGGGGGTAGEGGRGGEAHDDHWDLVITDDEEEGSLLDAGMVSQQLL
jgi:hypothetical protein